MIPKDCKRLAEVDFPIAVVSKHAAREKSIRHGHPSTLHLWWARRPLASSRAVLLGLLLPDPCDALCPHEFKTSARELLPQVGCGKGETDEKLRQGLLKFIGDFANWDLAANRTYLEVSRGLVKAAHGEEPPLVVDPFAGGGSIPLEALRLGCEAFASDLNPVAFLILRMMLEEMPRHGQKLADELRCAGAEVKRRAAKELAKCYPADPEGGQPVGYLWARTVRCEAPRCGAEIPIFKSGWLSKRSSKRARFFKEDPEGKCIALVIERAPIGGPIQLRIARGQGSAEGRDGFHELETTKAKGNNSTVLCPCCKTVLLGERVMVQLAEQNGGGGVEFDSSGRRTGGATLLAVVTSSRSGRCFRPPSSADYAAASVASQADANSAPGKEAERINPVRPSPNARGLTAPTRYGASRFADLFTPRQRVAIRVLIRCITAWGEKHPDSDALALGLTLALGRCIDQSSAHVRWLAGIQAIASSFPRQAVQMTWDFVESVPIGDESANFGAAVEWVSKVIEAQGAVTTFPGQVLQADAEHLPLPKECCGVLFTDPPYYDAVPYSDLANFFFVWLSALLPIRVRQKITLLDAEGLSLSEPECIWHRGQLVNGQPKERAFFEEKISLAFREACSLIRDDGIFCVVFAHKTTEGWEALLGGLVAAGLVVRSSWPIATERSARTNAQGTASLATSVHLVCRPRPGDAPVGDWADVLRELPKRVGDWMERLQGEGVRGADLVFACIGPALEIFSRYAKVETAEGREVKLDEYLEKVWEVVGRSALAQVLGTAEARARNGAAGAVEEDARLTALFLWALQSTNGETADAANGDGKDEERPDEDDDEEGTSRGKAKGFTLVFDVVRRFAQPLGIELPRWEGRVIETKKGVVRLLPIAERAKQLFGEEGAQAVATRLEQEAAAGPNPLQGVLFPDMRIGAPSAIRGRGRGRGKRAGVEVSNESLAAARETTTLDRVHAAMLLQAGGRTNALRALLEAEQERGPDLLRLANALSALYPKGSEEKRLLDAMLLAVPR